MNIGTFVVLLILIALVCMIIRKMVRDRRAGKSYCGCDCGNCAASCGQMKRSKGQKK